MIYYAPCTYCRTEKAAPSGNCFNCGAPLLEVLGTYCGRPITNMEEWRKLTLERIKSARYDWGLPLSGEVMT